MGSNQRRREASQAVSHRQTLLPSQLLFSGVCVCVCVCMCVCVCE